MEQVLFRDVPISRWDEWVAQIDESTYLHTSEFLTHLERSYPAADHLSFALIDQGGTVQALCPLAICNARLAGNAYVEASFCGEPLAAPAVLRLAPSSGMRIQAEAYARLHEVAASRGAARILLRRHPVSLAVQSGGDCGFNAFVPLLEGYQAMPQNTVVMDLSLSEEALEGELSKYQRRHIRRARRDGLRVLRFTGGDAESAAMFDAYRQAHRIAAGRVTRDESSFEWMKHLMAEARASLYVTLIEDAAAAFLFCGSFQRLGFGWSQANLPEYVERSPRHLLEWEAILDHRRRGYAFYEVGIVWSARQPYRLPSCKELSIGEFKRRYGGRLLPEISFERITDGDLWAALERERADAFLASDAFDRITAESAHRIEE